MPQMMGKRSPMLEKRVMRSSMGRTWRCRGCRWSGRFVGDEFEDAAVGVDEAGVAGVDGAGDGDAVFDGTELGGLKVLVEFDPVEPAVVGDVDEEIGFLTGGCR